jgi:purine-binding chemotaxis protein CheW
MMEEKQLVVFELAGEAYGVNVAQVQSIIPMQNVVVVPGVPPFVEGVVNLRGAVVPVVDLCTRFGLTHPTKAGKRVIVIVELKDLQVGLIVDKVREVTKIPETEIEPPSPLLTSIDNAYLIGIGKIGERPVILLDLGRIFSLDEQSALLETA